MARGSLISQVNYAFQSLNCIGRSRHRRKVLGKKCDAVYHGKTMKTYVGHSCTFAKWCKEKYGIKYLVEINQDMCQAYFQELIREGKSPYTLPAIRSALRKLEIAIRKTYHHSSKIVPPDLELPKRQLKLRRGRHAYTEQQVKEILANANKIDPRAAEALEVQFLFGLRISELLNLRVKDIDFNRNMLVVWRGKGGRLRQVPINNKAVEVLKKLTAGKEEDELLFTFTVLQLERIMEKACKMAGIEHHKTHNLRHSYAVKQYKKYIKQGMDDIEARKEVSQLLGHNRVDVTYAYIPAQREG